MKSLTYFGVSGQQAATNPVHCLKVEGFNKDTTNDRWLQVHDSATVPAESAVPKRQRLVPALLNFYWDFTIAELSLQNGLYVCLSDTEGSKTLSASTMDLQVELTDPESPSGLTAAGDLTTGVTHLQVWADSAGPKKLVKLEVGDKTLSVTSYLQLFAHDSPTNGDTALAEWKMTPSMAALVLSFGAFGRDVMSLSASTIRDGATLWLSTTAGILTKSLETVTIKASYK